MDVSLSDNSQTRQELTIIRGKLLCVSDPRIEAQGDEDRHDSCDSDTYCNEGRGLRRCVKIRDNAWRRRRGRSIWVQCLHLRIEEAKLD